ncbi:alpha/beta hydrolase [Paracidovorax anthurii]|uniref:Alpha/beta hydrolase family protein n=1 Tax=Paracidovorax anthurii TaxID=78229 RepID=A0A328YAG7_9BURK|nr:alpha/beta hydrolase [Paracidovorax anthurii]RAR70173.1 alpha/beta hydrolase family protein [Paracidovorax anthurii]
MHTGIGTAWLRRAAAGVVALAMGVAVAAHAAPGAADAIDGVAEAGADTAWTPPAGLRLLRDLPYGADPRQRMDVYLPEHPRGAPVVFMVHGGAWKHGDKAGATVVRNKVAHWVPRGAVLVSINYRMLPDAGPPVQVRDVARALAEAQRLAPGWGADPRRFVAMGHSAGAHLVALLMASPALQREAGALPVLATVALDSAAMDVPRVMRARHAPLYDHAFGRDPAQWESVSPAHQLRQSAPPLLAVCSSRRAIACDQAHRLAAQAQSLGMRAEVLPQDLNHRGTNEQLGLPGAYTDAVDAFLRSVGGAP